MVKGVFPLFSSLTGLPLQDILEILKQNNMVVDWVDFYEQSIKEGWKPDRTIIKIRDSVGDVFGSKYGEEVKKRLIIFKKRGENLYNIHGR